MFHQHYETRTEASLQQIAKHPPYATPFINKGEGTLLKLDKAKALAQIRPPPQKNISATRKLIWFSKSGILPDDIIALTLSASLSSLN
jgi:hypothetical protein